MRITELLTESSTLIDLDPTDPMAREFFKKIHSIAAVSFDQPIEPLKLKQSLRALNAKRWYDRVNNGHFLILKGSRGWAMLAQPKGVHNHYRSGKSKVDLYSMTDQGFEQEKQIQFATKDTGIVPYVESKIGNIVEIYAVDDITELHIRKKRAERDRNPIQMNRFARYQPEFMYNHGTTRPRHQPIPVKTGSQAPIFDRLEFFMPRMIDQIKNQVDQMLASGKYEFKIGVGQKDLDRYFIDRKNFDLLLDTLTRRDLHGWLWYLRDRPEYKELKKSVWHKPNGAPADIVGKFIIDLRSILLQRISKHFFDKVK